MTIFNVSSLFEVFIIRMVLFLIIFCQLNLIRLHLFTLIQYDHFIHTAKLIRDRTMKSLLEFDCYEDYLNSFVSVTDLYYLQSINEVRRFVLLGYRYDSVNFSINIVIYYKMFFVGHHDHHYQEVNS